MTAVPHKPVDTAFFLHLTCATNSLIVSEMAPILEMSPPLIAPCGVGIRPKDCKVAPERPKSTSASLIELVPMSSPTTFFELKKLR
jgi:hypothetical protein